MLLIEKVCPIILRDAAAGKEILVFRHPQAGIQLVKGTREPSESVESAALRELVEEAGIAAECGPRQPWSSGGIAEGQQWHFLPVDAPSLPDRFVFHTSDDGGHLFAFFWWPLHVPAIDDWHETFRRALAEIRQHIG